jgi:pimeloyl-ACP methyl ester carboxylesterase
MKTTTLESHGGKIVCHDSEGAGRTLVLVHGNSASSGAFAKQLDGTLGQKHRVIAFDLPGHGKSDNASNPATTYNIPGYARVLRDVVKQLGVEDAVFAGWSLGGHIVLEAAPDLPRAKGFAIFGTPPLGFPPIMDNAFLPNPTNAYIFTRDLSEEQARTFVASAFKPGVTELPPQMIADVLRTDGRARELLVAQTEASAFRDEVEIVASLKQPLAVLHGAQEQLINGAYFDTLTMPTLWRGKVQVIDDAGHIPQWEQPEKFNAMLDAFVGET